VVAINRQLAHLNAALSCCGQVLAELWRQTSNGLGAELSIKRWQQQAPAERESEADRHANDTLRLERTTNFDTTSCSSTSQSELVAVDASPAIIDQLTKKVLTLCSQARCTSSQRLVRYLLFITVTCVAVISSRTIAAFARRQQQHLQY